MMKDKSVYLKAELRVNSLRTYHQMELKINIQVIIYIYEAW